MMRLAKVDSRQAAKAILTFVQEQFPDLNSQKIKINESKVSLNSVNGFIITPGKEYFFKFHAEEGEEHTMGCEYYQSQMLTKAGWPMLKPIYKSTEPGSQFLIYPRIEAQTAFDEFEKLDAAPNPSLEQKLLAAEARLLKKEGQAFLDTLQISDAQNVAESPLYQLFYTRLVSKNDTKPRLDIYYTGKIVVLPNGETINFNNLAKKKWIINNIEYNESLNEIINQAKNLLDPLKEKKLATVVGHGDDHNGNKFYVDGDFIFFDPAFAGRQPALLSFIKATAHNTFLHPFWLYDPAKIEEYGLEFNFAIKDDKIIINHNWGMTKLSQVRQKILNLQSEKVWKPLIKTLREHDALPDYYEKYLRKALFCCPFLVYDLIDGAKYSPQQSLLAISKCVELGSKGNKENYTDTFLKKLRA